MPNDYRWAKISSEEKIIFGNFKTGPKNFENPISAFLGCHQKKAYFPILHCQFSRFYFLACFFSYLFSEFHSKTLARGFFKKAFARGHLCRSSVSLAFRSNSEQIQCGSHTSRRRGARRSGKEMWYTTSEQAPRTGGYPAYESWPSSAGSSNHYKVLKKMLGNGTNS